MKKNIILIGVTVLIVSCGGEVKVNEEKLNETGEKLQETVKKGADSVGSKLKRLTKKLDDDSSK